MDAANHLLSARRARWAVAALFFGNGFVVGSWAPHIPLLQERLGITESTLGLLILCFGIGALLSMPWCGWLMARFGQRSVLRFFALAQSLGLLLVVLSPTVPVAALAAVVFGATIGCTDVAMNAAVVPIERRLDRAVMSSMHGFWSLGGFAGAALGGWLVQGFGAQAHAAGIGAAVFALGLFVAPYFLDWFEQPAAAEHKPRRVALPRSPILYLLGVIALFTFVSEGAVLDWGALYLRGEFGADVFTASLAYAMLAGGMALMRFLGDGIRDRFGAVPTMRASALVAALSMLAAALAPNAWTVILAFGVCGLGVANTVPIAFSAAGNQPGISVGAGMSVVTTMGYAGILLAPSTIGFAGEHWGFAPIFAVLAFLLFVVFLMSPLVAAADAPATATPGNG